MGERHVQEHGACWKTSRREGMKNGSFDLGISDGVRDIAGTNIHDVSGLGWAGLAFVGLVGDEH
jgi:hypothetical protein